MAKEKNVRKGLKFRPCIKCGETVNFIPWVEESKKRQKWIWHWANQDGTHHLCWGWPEQRHIKSICAEQLQWEKYEQLKSAWKESHPNSTSEEYTNACRKIAADLGV